MNDPLEKKETIYPKKNKLPINEEPKQKNLGNFPVTNKNEHSSDPLRRGVALLGIALAFIGVAYFLISPESRKISSNQTLENTRPGLILAANDSVNLIAKDFKVELPKSSDRKYEMLIWDYANEDGDVVEVLVNGKSLGPPFMIKHKPNVFYIEVPSTIQVKGVKDGVGGISYAAYFSGGNLTYFNLAPVGGLNNFIMGIKP
ncbi:hypothetical protein EHO60_08985 [Leptospira fletcheri]|uniref:Uncharacterized protein n=1 Tax=Leptospira fletcheri TaxID=2484981 RepID=A0A4R9GHY3_9LEPT|nr:hypothetical protein [Leptospira fletcheri]TGK12374.1 hypothetical protein EHO60_08985 [Leptospira fletcheri]